jgi:hypothetical protein
MILEVLEKAMICSAKFSPIIEIVFLLENIQN